MNLNFLFNSADHIRYQNGIQVAGPFGNVNRCIKVEPNINGCEGYDIKGGIGYIVTIFNLDGDHPVWQNNIQVTPKPMKIISQDANKVVLRGYPVLAMSPMGWIDFDGQDYGLTIFLTNGIVTKCVLHMHDRNTDIEYINGKTVEIVKEPELDIKSQKANLLIKQGNLVDGRILLIEIYNLVLENPKILNKSSEIGNIGVSFLLMLENNLTQDENTLKAMASLSYYCLSKALELDKNNASHIKHRLLLFEFYFDIIKHTVRHLSEDFEVDPSPFNFFGDTFLWVEVRDNIYKMQIADLYSNPALFNNIPFFLEVKNEFDSKIRNEHFGKGKSIDSLKQSGLELNKRLLYFLENKIINKGNLAI